LEAGQVLGWSIGVLGQAEVNLGDLGAGTVGDVGNGELDLDGLAAVGALAAEGRSKMLKVA